jgi:hypothetical protein
MTIGTDAWTNVNGQSIINYVETRETNTCFVASVFPVSDDQQQDQDATHTYSPLTRIT